MPRPNSTPGATLLALLLLAGCSAATPEGADDPLHSARGEGGADSGGPDLTGNGSEAGDDAGAPGARADGGPGLPGSGKPDAESPTAAPDASVSDGGDAGSLDADADASADVDGSAGDADVPNDGPCEGRSAGEVCRISTGACDVEERCDGVSADCPADEFAAPGAACDDGRFCTAADLCDGSGACIGSGDPCAAEVGDADDDCSESCHEAEDACTRRDPNGTPCTAGRACEQHLCIAGACTPSVACPVFVDPLGSDGEGCGEDWGATACASPQGGSDEASRVSNRRVFVRAGTYVPGPAGPVLSMADGLAYYGGFTGAEYTAEARQADFATGSVLDGGGVSAHVVQGAAGARLDGFTITGGVGGPGAGMLNDGTDGITVAHTRFVANIASGTSAVGGGVLNEDVEAAVFQDVLFTDNLATGGSDARGAGMASLNSTVTMLDVRFLSNIASASRRASGGGLFDDNTQSTLDGAAFEANRAVSQTTHGGAYRAQGDGAFTTELLNTDFVGNEATGTARGGAFAIEGLPDAPSMLSLTDVAFAGNTTASLWGSGGGLSTRYAHSVLRDVSFVDNSTRGKGGGGMHTHEGSTSIKGAQFIGNHVGGIRSGFGGGLHMWRTEATLSDVDFVANSASGHSYGAGGGLFVASARTPATISNVGFFGNIASGGYPAGAGMEVGWDGGNKSVTITQTSFVGNRFEGSSSTSGSALFVGEANAKVNNVVISSNDGDEVMLWGQRTHDIDYWCGVNQPGLTNHTPIDDPATAFTELASGHVLLAPGSACADSANESYADAALGDDAWQNMTTFADGSLDTSAVDHGRHYQPDALLIHSFERPDANTASWTVAGGGSVGCRLTGGALAYEVPPGDIAAGSTTHTEGDVELTLTCRRGGLFARARSATP